MPNTPADPNLSNAVSELIPRKVRLVLYVVVTIAMLGLSIWLASDGDTLEAVLAIFGALSGTLAASNINPPTTGGQTDE